MHKEHEEATICITDPRSRHEFLQDLTSEFVQLQSTLEKIAQVGAVDPSLEDAVVCVGEKLSARLLTCFLADKGVDAEYVDLSNIVNFPVTTLNQQSYRDLSIAVGSRLRALSAKTIPVITGFFGPIPGGVINGVSQLSTHVSLQIVLPFRLFEID